MKIEYEFPRHGIEADVKVIEDEATGMVKVVIEPYFFSQDASPAVAFVKTTTQKGRTLHREVQNIAGKTGSLRRQLQAKRVKPRCDLPLEAEPKESESEAT